MSGDALLVGQTLQPGEIPATNARNLSGAQRAALTLCLAADRLDYRGRCGWHQPGHAALRIKQATIDALHRAGLLVIVGRSRFARHARLTIAGDWYARTLISEAMEIATMPRMQRQVAIVLTTYDADGEIIELIDLPADLDETTVREEVKKAKASPRVARVRRDNIFEKVKQ